MIASNARYHQMHDIIKCTISSKYAGMGPLQACRWKEGRKEGRKAFGFVNN
jgi:hypothetical protein